MAMIVDSRAVARPANTGARKRRRLFFVGGAKGGTGKTMTAVALIDYLRQKGAELIIVESDSSNSDVWHCFLEKKEEKVVPKMEPPATVYTFDLQQHEEWLRLVDLCEGHQNATIVINSKGGNAEEVERYGPILNDTLDEIPHELVTLWVLNLYRDSVNALTRFHETVPKSRLHTILNECWGQPEDFYLYQTSEVRTLIHEGDPKQAKKPLGSTHFVPRVAPRILTGVFNERQPLEKLASSPSIATRSEVARWRRAMGKIFDEVDA